MEYDDTGTRALRALQFLFPFLFMACAFYARAVDHDLYLQVFLKEDGPVEWLTAAFYLAAAVLASSVSRSLRKSGHSTLPRLYFMLALGFLFVCFEEISWGQRILGIGTPSLLSTYNLQHEMNIHNIAGGRSLHIFYILVGLYGMTARPVLRRFLRRDDARVVDLCAPDVRQWPYFLAPFLFYFYWDYISPLEKALWGDYVLRGSVVDAKLQEPAEMLLAMGFLSFAFVNWLRQRQVRQGLPHMTITEPLQGVK